MRLSKSETKIIHIDINRQLLFLGSMLFQYRGQLFIQMVPRYFCYSRKNPLPQSASFIVQGVIAVGVVYCIVEDVIYCAWCYCSGCGYCTVEAVIYCAGCYCSGCGYCTVEAVIYCAWCYCSGCGLLYCRGCHLLCRVLLQWMWLLYCRGRHLLCMVLLQWVWFTVL